MSDPMSITLRLIGEFPADSLERPGELRVEPNALQPETACAGSRCEQHMVTSAELMQLHVRVIALENLVIALLSEASERQLDLARGLASYIAPRPESTQHALTTQAAAQMRQFVDRSTHFRPL